MSEARNLRYRQVPDPLLRELLGEVFRRLDDLDLNGAALTIPASAVTATMLADDSVASRHIQADAVGPSEIASNAVGVDELSTAVAGAGLTGGGGAALAVNPDGTTLEISGDTVRQKDGGTTAAKLADALAALIQGSPSFTVGAEAADVITVTVQLKDADATNLAAATLCQVWLSDTAGAAVTGTAPSGAVTVTTGTLKSSITAKTDLWVASNASGAIVITIEEAGARTWYLNLEFQGKVSSSGAITFA